jgi:clan AA aspartic protease (TIGR02281 family)
VQRYGSSDAEPADTGPAKLAPADRPGRRVYQIPVDPAGGALVVVVRINDLVSAPFVVDTGASDVVLPEALAEALGLRPDRRTPQQTYGTANGAVRVPVVTLESVQVGEARVENVRAAILPNVAMGLLGLSFFDHFAYSIEREQGLLTLVREEGAPAPNEGHWRRRFATLRAQLHAVEGRMGGLTSAHTRLQEDLEAQKTALEAELGALDLEADRAGVPQSWRQ